MMQMGGVHPGMMDGEDESEDEAAFVERARQQYEMQKTRSRSLRSGSTRGNGQGNGWSP